MAYFGDTRDMACSRVDLERWLREFTGRDRFETRGEALVLPADGFDLLVTLVVLPPRRLGLVSFHLSRVSFEYPPEHQTAARDWIRRFDFHTQRGGG